MPAYCLDITISQALGHVNAGIKLNNAAVNIVGKHCFIIHNKFTF